MLVFIRLLYHDVRDVLVSLVVDEPSSVGSLSIIVVRKKTSPSLVIAVLFMFLHHHHSCWPRKSVVTSSKLLSLLTFFHQRKRKKLNERLQKIRWRQKLDCKFHFDLFSLLLLSSLIKLHESHPETAIRVFPKSLIKSRGNYRVHLVFVGMKDGESRERHKTRLDDQSQRLMFNCGWNSHVCFSLKMKSSSKILVSLEFLSSPE